MSDPNTDPFVQLKRLRSQLTAAQERERELIAALEKVMDETGTSSLAHHAARDALKAKEAGT